MFTTMDLHPTPTIIYRLLQPTKTLSRHPSPHLISFEFRRTFLTIIIFGPEIPVTSSPESSFTPYALPFDCLPSWKQFVTVFRIVVTTDVNTSFNLNIHYLNQYIVSSQGSFHNFRRVREDRQMSFYTLLSFYLVLLRICLSLILTY